MNLEFHAALFQVELLLVVVEGCIGNECLTIAIPACPL